MVPIQLLYYQINFDLNSKIGKQKVKDETKSDYKNDDRYYYCDFNCRVTYKPVPKVSQYSVNI